MKFKCAHCGKEVDLNDDNQANWYENQKEFINDDEELEIWGKVQHLGDECGEVSYLIFKGKLSEVKRRG